MTYFHGIRYDEERPANPAKVPPQTVFPMRKNPADYPALGGKLAERDMPDHVAATVEVLSGIVAKLEAGTAPEDLGRTVELVGRMMARRT